MAPEIHMATPTLDQFGVNLTLRAIKGELDPLIGREKEVTRAINILTRRTKNNPVFVGAAGVGKTAIAEGIAQRIASKDVPKSLRNARVIAIELAKIVAGTKLRGEFEERLRKIIDEVIEDKNVILFIDELHAIIGAGSAEGSLDAANILKTGLARRELRIVGATTIEEYRRIEKDKSLTRRFQVVNVPPSTNEETVAILFGLRPHYELFHGVVYSNEVIHKIVSWADRYISTNFMPDRAIDLMDEAGAAVRRRSESLPPAAEFMRQRIAYLKTQADMVRQDKAAVAELFRERMDLERQFIPMRAVADAMTIDGDCHVFANDVAEVIKNINGIDVSSINEDEEERLLGMEAALHKRVVGQVNPVSALCKAVRRARVGLKDPKRPTGSFLFLGPTGVGKTEVARALAEYLFGTENAMIRFDMSEFMEKHSVSRLIGAPPGYVGYEGGGQLTEKVRKRPYCVILLDEIEKAHPDVWNLLLQVFEDGQLTDGLGNTVDFKNTIIIMTSNVGAKLIGQKSQLGFGAPQQDAAAVHSNRQTVISAEVKRELKRVMAPELINRIDEIDVFQQLTRDEVRQIIDGLAVTLRKVASERGIELELSEAGKNYLMDNGGFDPEYGARPMRRTIQSLLENPFAEALLLRQFVKGDKVVAVVADGKLTFEKECLASVS